MKIIIAVNYFRKTRHRRFLTGFSISSNVNEVIRTVLNSLFIYFFFFYENISHAPKAQKHKDATNQKHETLQANKNKKCA